ncbi:DUF6448 family protein [Streptomyces collinus]|uniref:DUF6448 family protein n=1 Tax=Streptomyces collinus TaxID=42684 RepID=UPI0034325E96
MPPHCDSLDGPVVTAARKALEGRDVDQILPYVPEEGEPEVREAFGLTAKARTFGREAQEVADRWFFETVVRVHRSGEGAPFTGLKPAGLDVGPVIPVAESGPACRVESGAEGGARIACPTRTGARSILGCAAGASSLHFMLPSH